MQILAWKEFSQSIFFFVQSKKALNFELLVFVTVNETVNNKTKTQGEKFLLLFLSKKMEFRTYFALSHTFSHN